MRATSLVAWIALCVDGATVRDHGGTRANMVEGFRAALAGDVAASHVDYVDRFGKDRRMKVDRMAEKLADQNLSPPMGKDADGRLKSREEAGEYDSLEAFAKGKPQLARHARVARLAHARLRRLGHDLGALVGARNWGNDTATPPPGRLCATRRVLLLTEREDGRVDVAVRASELFGVLVLRKAWVVDDDGTRGDLLAVPPRPKVALFVVLARRIAKTARWRDAVLPISTAGAVGIALAVVGLSRARRREDEGGP
jgi:hypothetical protein